MKNIIASIVIVCAVVYSITSCRKEDQRTRFTYYFIDNQTTSNLRVVPSILSSTSDIYCDNCIVAPNTVNQLASNITTVGDTPPYETFDKINIYRNDTLKMVLQDSSLVHFPWIKKVQTETITDYTFTITNL